MRFRIAEVEPADSDVIEVTKSKRAEPRIPFGWVVERGLLPVGAVLQGTRKHQTAKVRADGTLVCSDATGSIHQMGAHVQGLDACNGWTFWQYEDKGKLIPIDLKAGDRVLFGKWSGTEVKIDGEDLLIMKESDILGIIG